MFNLRLFANCSICICTGIGFLYGMFRCFGKEYPLFLKGIIGAMGCLMGGRLFAAVLQLCGGDSIGRLNLGYIGLVGCFLFLLSVCHGEINEFIKAYKNRTASVIGCLAPIPILILVWMIIKTDTSVPYRVLGIIVALLVMVIVTYLFQFMILLDGGDGFLKMFRPCSVLLLIFSYSQLGEIYFSIRQNTVMLIITYVFICVIGVILVPILERRVTKWMNK